jgi:transcriptional regulator with XRE-family HTH domain
MSKFPEILRKLRIAENLKQSDIAKEIEMSVQSYSAYENNREPSYDLLIKLADRFGVSTDYLLGRSEFKNTVEEFSLKDDSVSGGDDDWSPDVLSINLYREIKGCAENARLFYKEKMRTDDGSRELLFCFQEKISGDVALFNQVFDILMYYRDFSDRDAAIKAFLLGTDDSQLTARVVEEISRIDREI